MTHVHMCTGYRESKDMTCTISKGIPIDMEGRVCLVTGGGSGVGAATATLLAKKGARVLVGDVNAKAAEDVSLRIKECVSWCHLDVASHSSFESAFEKCIKEFGRVDCLVNCAGLVGETAWETQIVVNLLGTIRGCKLALKHMAENGGGGGSVVNISSVNALVTRPTRPVYAAGKAGIVQYTRCAGHKSEFERTGVRMVCLCPNGIDTPLLAGPESVKTKFELEESEWLEGKGWGRGRGRLTAEEVAEAIIRLLDGQGSPGSVWFMHGRGDREWEVEEEEEESGWGRVMGFRK